MQQSEDLEYLCAVYHMSGKINESIDVLKTIIGSGVKIDKKKRDLFSAVYKAAIDSRRSLLFEYGNVVRDLCDLMDAIYDLYLDKYHDEVALLISYCKDAIGMIENILRGENDIPTIVYFIRFRGDLYRYICEFADSDESESSSKKAEEAYKEALDICEGNLPKEDPIRLGLLLNKSIFLYEIKHNIEEAYETISYVLQDYEICVNNLSLESQTESQEILAVMKDNLNNWACEIDFMSQLD